MPVIELELDEAQQKEIVGVIRKGKADCEAERVEQAEKWKLWRMYRENQKEHQGPKNYPYPNSSNVSVPVTQMVTNTIFAHTQQMFGQKKPFWNIQSQLKGRAEEVQASQEEARIISKYFNMVSESQQDMNLRGVNRDVFLEATSMGTSWTMMDWTREGWYMKSSDEQGNIRNVEMVVHHGLKFRRFELEDFYYPSEFRDVQSMPWIFWEERYPWHEVEAKGRDGVWQNWRRLEGHGESQLPDDMNQAAMRKGKATEPSGDLYRVQRGFVFLDVDGDGYVEDLLVTVSVDAGVLLSVDFNELGIRPIEPFRHMNRPGDLEGIGTGAATQDMQEEATATHNLRIDNMKMANARMAIVSKSAVQMTRSERVYPGKIWYVDAMDVRTAIQPFQLGEVYPSSIQSETMAVDYAQRASGANDAMSGFANDTVKTRDGMGMQNTRLQQGRGVLASTNQGIEGSFARIGLFMFFQCVLHRAELIQHERRAKRLTEEEISTLDRALRIQPQDIPTRYMFTIRTSDISETFEAKRQNYLTLTQLYSVYIEKVFPMLQMLQDQEQMQAFAMKAVAGMSKLMEETFKLLGEAEAEEYVPDLQINSMISDFILAMRRDVVEQQLEAQRAQVEAQEDDGTIQSAAGAGDTVRPGPGNTGAIQRVASGNGQDRRMEAGQSGNGEEAQAVPSDFNVGV